MHDFFMKSEIYSIKSDEFYFSAFVICKKWKNFEISTCTFMHSDV